MAQHIKLQDVRVLLREYIRKGSRLGTLLTTYEKTGNLIIGGSLVIPTAAVSGYVLTSDADGVATWQPPDGAGHLIQDEGVSLIQRTALDFVGTGVSVSDLGGKTTVDIPGNIGHIIEDEGTPLTQRGTINFVGAGVTVTDLGGKTNVSIISTPAVLEREEHTATSGQTLFSLGFTYPIDGKSLHVYYNGALMRPGIGEDYLETSTSSITFNVGRLVGSNLVFEYWETINAPSLTDADTVDGFHAAATYQANQLIALDSQAKFPDGLTVSGSGIVEGTMYASAFSSLSPLKLQTGGTTRFYIDDTTGYVGVGTETPEGALDVAGAIYIDKVASAPSPSAGRAAIYIKDDGKLYIHDGDEPSEQEILASGHTVQDEGITLAGQPILDFAGAGVTVTDEVGKTLVTIPGGGGSGTYNQDLFTASGPSDKTLNLSNTPVTDSELVTMNGVVVRKGASNDYTISGSVVTINAAVDVTTDDQFLVIYAS